MLTARAILADMIGMIALAFWDEASPSGGNLIVGI
jgi:hypothetical protein